MKLDIFPRVGASSFAVLLGLVLMGCGGGGGGDGDDGDSNPNPPAQDFAPGSVSGQTLTLDAGDGNPRQITFNSESLWAETRNGDNTGGSYEYRPSDNRSTADLLLTGNGTSTALTLYFGSSGAGTFIYNSGETGQGNFSLQAANPGPGDPPGGNNGLAPSSLSGTTMYGTRTFTSTGPVGQTHVYTFSANGFHDSDPPEESDGVYTYTPDRDRATLTLAYFAPGEFNGDRHEWSMNFRTEKSGSFQSVYTRRDGTVIRINGEFQIQ